MGVKCFVIEPTQRARRWFRRHSDGAGKKMSNICPLMPGDYSYHQAMVLGEDCDQEFEDWSTPGGGARRVHKTSPLDPADPRWPTKCACGYEFTESDAKQTFHRLIYKMPDGREVGLQPDLPGLPAAPPGAMYFADWMLVDGSNWHRGPDGHCLAVVCPGEGIWLIDGCANNCDKKSDKEHKCWCRHGTPPLITVDKNCNTCGAGGGSIQTHNYHGMLTNGEFNS